VDRKTLAAYDLDAAAFAKENVIDLAGHVGGID
jgi:hypothetical protein